MKKKDISYTFRTGKTRRLSDLFITIPDGSGGYSFTKAYSIFKVFCKNLQSAGVRSLK